MARHWLITGINSGFGRHMAEILLARGDRVAGTVRDPASVADLADRHGDRLWLTRLDLSDFAAIRSAVDQAFAALGRLDVIVSNAGYGLFGAAEALSDAQVLHQVQTNLLGSIQLIRATLPHLREQGGGRILQLSSYGGQATLPGGSLYHASKWGIEGFAEAVGREVAAFGIGITLVEPGGARTAFRKTASTHLAEELAAYKGTPAGMVHRILQDPARLPPGDSLKMVQAMIASVDVQPAPRRLLLGSDAYAAISAALTERLAEIEAQRERAALTDID